MKKIALLLLLVVCTIALGGCGQKNVEGTLEDIMTKVYADVKDDEKPMMLGNVEVTSENAEYYLGSSDIEYKEALASESMIGSIAHSVVLVRVKENADVEKIKTQIKESINPRKWICVGVEDEDVIVENIGDLVVLILVQEETTRGKIENSFNNLLK